MFSIWHKFKFLDYRYHLVLALAVHVVVIQYGIYHDDNYTVPFTDVDYKVFTDASRHVLNGASPYNRHTYRYTPIIALLLVPNILIHHSFGKLLFSIIDVVVALLIRLIVKHSMSEYDKFRQVHECKLPITYPPDEKLGKRRRKRNKTDKKSEVELVADTAMMLWLYNPMTIAIATRGNCDSIAGLFVLSTLYVVQIRRNPFIAGLLHGIAVHIRLYPIAYSLALFMYLSKFSFYSPNYRQVRDLVVDRNKSKSKKSQSENMVVSKDKTQQKQTIFKIEYIYYLIPNLEQIKLISGCVLSLSSLTAVFYLLYGYEFLHETYVYHLLRKDTRHNFSMYFYLQYLTAGIKNIGFWQKILTILPQVLLLLVFSVRYGLNKLSLNFAFLTLTIIMVAYNTVLTSQYFIWILVVLPLCIWQIKMSQKTAFFLIMIWLVAQAAWLLPAYFLEFQGHNTFMFIWVQSVSFFCANMAILGRIIKSFMPSKIEYKIN